MMKSKRHGKSTLKLPPVEILNVSMQGVWLFVNDHEYFLSHKEFPWFKDAKIVDICNVELSPPNHLYWPTLDVDLTVEQLRSPEKWPLVAKG